MPLVNASTFADPKNGAGIDLNPGFAKAFSLTPPFLIPGVKWEWV